MIIRNDILLKRRCMLYVPETDTKGLTKDDLRVPAAMNLNLKSLGYRLSPELCVYIAKYNRDPQNQFGSKFFFKILQTIKEMVGADVVYKPFYPNFPQQVIDTPELLLYINALLHYTTGYRPDEDTAEPREEIKGFNEEEKPLKEIRLATYDDYMDTIKSFIYAKVSLNNSSMQDFSAMISSLTWDELLTLFNEPIPNKENLAKICNILLNRVEHTKALKVMDLYPILKPSISSAVDVLRLASVFSGEGSILIHKFCVAKHLKNQQRKLLMALLDDCKNALEDLSTYKPHVKSLAASLHPVNFKNNYPHAYEVFQTICSDSKYQTYNSVYENLVSTNRLEGLVNHLAKRPGLYVRHLHQMLEMAGNNMGKVDLICSTLVQICPKVAMKPLLDARVHFRCNRDERYYVSRTGSGSLYEIEPHKVKLSSEVISKVQDAISTSIRTLLSGKEKLGKVYLSEEMVNYSFPTVLRGQSEAERGYAIGSRMKYTASTDVIRLFLYWDTVRDLDLSCVAYDENFTKIDSISFRDLCNNKLGIVHSGDITQGEDGGAEFIDIDVKKALSAGVRYVTMDVRVYNYGYEGEYTFADCKKCYVGVMERKGDLSDVEIDYNTAQNGNLYDPSTVLTKMDISCEKINCQPMVIDLLNSELISMGLNPEPQSILGNWVGRQTDLNRYLKYVVTTPFINIYEMIRFNCAARGAELVETPDEADVIFDVQQGITPYDLTILASEWM